MNPQYAFVKSSDEVKRLIETNVSKVEFISLLTAMTYNESYFVLELQNFNNGKPDASPHIAKLVCNDKNSRLLSRLVVSLISQFFGLEINNTNLGTMFHLTQIYREQLCFLKLRGELVVENGNHYLEPEDIFPVKLSTAIASALNNSDNVDGGVFYQTFENLIEMNNDPRSNFRIANFKEYNQELSNLVKRVTDSKKERERNEKALNPIFGAVRESNFCGESLDDFNSQFLASGETLAPFDSLDAIEESDLSSSYEYSQEAPNKRIKVVRSGDLIDLESIRASPLGTTKGLSGKIFAIYPTKPPTSQEGQHICLYFVPTGWPYDSTLILVPNVNCVEIYVLEGGQYYDMFIGFLQGADGFDEAFMFKELSIELERSQWEIKEGLFTAVWSLRRIKNDKLLEGLKMPSKVHPLKKDPLMTLSEIKLNSYDVKFVSMIALLVTCSFESPSFVKMTFTDFTTNSIPQKYLIDPFLIDFDNKLQATEGFRAIMYPDQFEKFNKAIKKEFNGKEIKEMFLSGAGENVSHRGIVCRMSLKLKMYDGKLNAIVRECKPLTRDTAGRMEGGDADEQRAFLHSFYERTIDSIPAQSIRKFYHFYTSCFPLNDADEEDGAISLGPLTATAAEKKLEIIPSIAIDDLHNYKLRSETDITQLNQNTELGVLFAIEGQVVGVSCDDARLQIVLTNSLFQQDFIDPTRIAVIEIFGRQNLQYFFNHRKPTVTREDVAQLERIVLGEELKLQITRGLVSLYTNRGQSSSLMVWCPVELTLQEIKSQLNSTASHLKEEQHDTLVKLEE